MSRHLHLDWETFSEADLKKVGAYRYAFDKSTTILCGALALGDEEPVVWDGFQGPGCYQELAPHIEAMRNPSVQIWCHNAMFEAAICQALLQKTWGIPCPDLSRFRCTMSLARRAALPSKLETLAEVLQLTNLKDRRGKALINKFSVMQKAKKPTKAHPNGLPVRRIRPEDEPEAFAEFCAYCAQDVRAEQEVARKLAYFDSEPNNSNYTLDAIINARGVPVNLPALRHAQKLIEEETEIVSAKFRVLTSFEVTQNAKLLAWCNVRNYARGCRYDFPNLQAETVDTFLEKYDGEENVDDVVRALRMKQSIAYASIKKVATMIACADPSDWRLRGMLSHHTATTGRWGSNLVQLQNFARSTIKHSESAYKAICEGISREMLEICYGPVLEVIGSTIRHYIHNTLPTASLNCPQCGAAPFGCSHGDFETAEEGEEQY